MPGAVAGGVLGLIGGCVIGGMAGGLPFATAEVLFRKYAEKFKILLENFEVLTEICQLLRKLKMVSKSLSEVEAASSCNAACDDCSEELDETNLNFLVRFRFDEFKRASQGLEKNCEYLLDDMPLKSLGFLSIHDTKSKAEAVPKNKLL